MSQAMIETHTHDLHHDHEHKMAGFNLYTFDDATGKLDGVEAHVLDVSADRFRIESVPLLVA